MTILRRARPLMVLALAMAVSSLVACGGFMAANGQSDVRCGRFEGPDCNDLLEIGLDAIARGRLDAPAVIAVDGACPPNARCMASVLGGETIAVIVHWVDGTMDWATIPLPDDWPASAAGPARLGDGPPPEHLQALVRVGG